MIGSLKNFIDWGVDLKKNNMGLKLGEFTDRDIESVSKMIAVLKYLNTGAELKIGDYTYRLAETTEEGFSFVFKMTVTSSNKSEREEWFGYQGNISSFSRELRNLTDDDITIMQANMTLNQINKRNG